MSRLPIWFRHQADERPGAIDVARRDDQVEAHRHVRVHQIRRCGSREALVFRAINGSLYRFRQVFAVETMPASSLSDLSIISRAHCATTGCGPSGKCRVLSILWNVSRMGISGLERNAGDAGQRLVLLGVEDVEDGADEERARGRLPVVALLALALGVDEDVGDVLHVADLAVAAADLEQRVEAHRVARGRLEPPAPRELAPPTGGERPELLLDVVDEGGGLPVQQRRDDGADAFA